MGKGREFVLSILRASCGDNPSITVGLRQVDIKLEIYRRFNKKLSRERIRQLVNSLVDKGLVKRDVCYSWKWGKKSMSKVKTYLIIN